MQMQRDITDSIQGSSSVECITKSDHKGGRDGGALNSISIRMIIYVWIEVEFCEVRVQRAFPFVGRKTIIGDTVILEIGNEVPRSNYP